MVVPVKQDAEPLGRSDRWGESILYATDLGATAISSVVVEYNYSSFDQEAIDYAYRHGVLLSLDSNDFDAMDHTDGMLFDHVFPGNSVTEDQSAPATRWFRARSNVTSYGTTASSPARRTRPRGRRRSRPGCSRWSSPRRSTRVTAAPSRTG